MSSLRHYDLEYCLTINVQSAKRRFIFFLSLVGGLAALTFLYDQEPRYGYNIVSIYAAVACFAGILLLFEKTKYIRTVGFLLCSSIFIHAVVQLGELLYESHGDTTGIWIGALVWFAFGYSFSVNWNMLMEPYFIGYYSFLKTDRKKSRCIGCSHRKRLSR